MRQGKGNQYTSVLNAVPRRMFEMVLLRGFPSQNRFSGIDAKT